MICRTTIEATAEQLFRCCWPDCDDATLAEAIALIAQGCEPGGRGPRDEYIPTVAQIRQRAALIRRTWSARAASAGVDRKRSEPPAIRVCDCGQLPVWARYSDCHCDVEQLFDEESA